MAFGLWIRFSSPRLESFLAEKEAVAEKEKELIPSLNSVLAKLGYEVVPMRAAPADGRRRRRRKPGRPRGARPGRPAKVGGREREGATIYDGVRVTGSSVLAGWGRRASMERSGNRLVEKVSAVRRVGGPSWSG